MAALGMSEGIAAEPASAATLAALWKLDFKRIEGPIVLVISGHALKDGAAQPAAAQPSIQGGDENLATSSPLFGLASRSVSSPRMDSERASSMRANRMFDVIVANGVVLDGTGGAAYEADLGFAGDRIAAIAARGEIDGCRRIEASGRIVAPGFIDSHTHDDGYLLVEPDMTPKISQGVTSVVIGNCGISLAPIFDRPPAPPMNLLGPDRLFRFRSMASYVAALESAPPAVNTIPLIGLTTLRRSVTTDLEKEATVGEVVRMSVLFDEALEAGVVGFSTGLFYPNAAASTPKEVIGVASAARGRNLVYATHLRNEADWIISALVEALDIRRKLDARILLSHHKLIGVTNHGRSKETIAIVHQRRLRQKIGLDLYPYAAGSSILNMKTVEGTERAVVSWSDPHPEYAGRDLEDVGHELGLSTADAIDFLSPAGGIQFMMSEADVKAILSYDATMIGSDGLPNDKHPHPRLWGTFPRVLDRYSRELNLMSLPEAVRRMTGLTAEFFDLEDRGFIKVGYKADSRSLTPIVCSISRTGTTRRLLPRASSPYS
jgi:N-acyl-D-amino-acid deacylase